jgi:hypothetical protein
MHLCDVFALDGREGGHSAVFVVAEAKAMMRARALAKKKILKSQCPRTFNIQSALTVSFFFLVIMRVHLRSVHPDIDLPLRGERHGKLPWKEVSKET